MAKAGPIVGLVGGTIMLVANFYQLQYLLMSLMYGYPSYRPIIPVFISLIVTISWAILGLVGAVFSLKDKRFGNILMLVAGAGAMVGAFVPINIYSIDSYGIGFTFLNGTAMFVDCTLMLIGGILGMTLKPRE
ncbi:MAG: hypothetical protein ACFE8U_18430 [Candidatus Hermodarchaeota archaeon]